MGYTADDVLKLATRLDTSFTFSSNRGPYRLEKVNIEGSNYIKQSDAPGGLVNVVNPIIDLLRKNQWGKGEKEPYDVIWISGRPEEEAGISRADLPLHGRYEDQYTGVRIYPLDHRYSQYLWKLRHNVRDRIDIEPGVVVKGSRKGFYNANQVIGAAIAHEHPDIRVPRIPISWTHDYHIPIANYYAREILRPSGRRFFGIHYDHIPWPHPNHINLLKNPQKYLSMKLSGNEIYGLQTKHDVQRFLETVETCLPIVSIKYNNSLGGYIVSYSGHETLVKAYPVSVDAKEFRERAEKPEIVKKAKGFRKEYGISEDAFVLFGVDRGGEKTKQVLRKIDTFVKFLNRYPEYIGKVVLYQKCDPSRQYLKDYRNELDFISKKAEEVKKNYPKNLILDTEWVEQDDLIPIYLAGDAVWINSIDGQNLVAKETAVIANMGRPKSILLSKYAGCSEQLTGAGAVEFDPFEIEDSIRAIKTVVNMPLTERQRHAEDLVNEVLSEDIYDYTGKVLTSILQVKRRGHWKQM